MAQAAAAPALPPRNFAWKPPLLAWGLVAALLLLTALGNVIAGAFPDPDDALRLVQVRDLIAGQGWYDFHQYRINPGAPPVMHWSRLVDLPLVALIGVLTPVIGPAAAEQLASVLVPLLALLVTMLALAKVAARLVERDAVVFACLSIGFMPLLVYQFQPMRIDHHGWQIAMVALAAMAVFTDRGWRGGALAGLAMAAGMTISIELLPVAAMFAGVLALRWLRDGAGKVWLVGFLQALATGLAVLFVATRGAADTALWCDAITWPHVAFFGIVAVGATALSALALRPMVAMAGLAVIGGAALAVFGQLSPECIRTPFGALDPVVRDFWYVNVREGRPLWEQSLSAFAVAFQIVVALAMTVWLRRRAKVADRRHWTDFALLLGGFSLLGLLVWRAMAFASVLATIPLGMVLHLGLAKFRSSESPAARIATVLGLFALLAPMALVSAASAVMQGAQTSREGGQGNISQQQQPVLIEDSTCDLKVSAETLDTLEPATIFAPLDIGPVILQHSRHSVIATAHHRAEDSMRDVILAFTQTPEQARSRIAGSGARFVALCTDLIEPDLYAGRGGASSLAARLLKGDEPDWLEPVALDTPETFRLWRVKN